MSSFLMVSGVLFWVLLGVLVLGGAVFLRRVRKRLRHEMLASMDPALPPRIEVFPMPDPRWEDPVAVGRQVRGLRGAGFTLHGSYRVEGFGWDTHLMALTHPEYLVAAVVCEAAGIVWTDVCQYYQSGRSLTVSNAPLGGELDQKPGVVKIHLTDAGPEELMAQMLAKRRPEPLVMIDGENFAEEFARICNEDIAWRNERGTTPEEIKRIADGMGIDVDPEEAALEPWEEQERKERVAIRAWLSTGQITALDWENIRERVFIVLAEDDEDTLRQYLEAFPDFGREMEETLSRQYRPSAAIEALAAVVRQLPEERGPRLLGEVASPRAVLYVYPEELF